MKRIFITLALIFSCIILLQAGEVKRIVSLGPTLTEQIFLLGAGDKIVGDTTYCIHPEAAKNKPKVGNVVDINVEKIVSLKPDIILATSLTNAKQLETLKQLGLKEKIIKFSEPLSYEEICKQFIRLGSIVGKEQEAEKIVKKSQYEVSAIIKKTDKLPKQTVFVEIGTNPLFAATGNTFIGNLIKFAGGTNIAENASQGIYSREKVVEDKPDVIIISSMGTENPETGKQEWEKFKIIPAVKNNEVYVINSYELCSPNPVTFPGLLQKISEMIHPKLKYTEGILDFVNISRN